MSLVTVWTAGCESETIPLCKFFISYEANCGPLSLINSTGIPQQENMAFKAEMTPADLVEVSFCISIVLEK